MGQTTPINTIWSTICMSCSKQWGGNCRVSLRKPAWLELQECQIKHWLILMQIGSPEERLDYDDWYDSYKYILLAKLMHNTLTQLHMNTEIHIETFISLSLSLCPFPSPSGHHAPSKRTHVHTSRIAHVEIFAKNATQLLPRISYIHDSSHDPASNLQEQTAINN